MKIGAWSMLLLVLEVQLLVLAAAALGRPANRRANRLLALALVVIAGLLTPYVIGYAGAYDRWPWLSFAPFAVPLALGPALYGYVVALAEDRAIARVHWLPGLLQFALQAAVFPWPLAMKNAFDGAVMEPVINPLSSAGLLVSIAGYGWLCFRVLARYRDWLRRRRRDERPAARLRVPIVALALLIAARAVYEAWDAVAGPIDYFDLFGYYILLGILGLILGLDGWRGAPAAVPPMIEAEPPDWAQRGSAWIERLAREGWWRDPALDLPALARLLGTNASQLSRALNAAEGALPAILARLRTDEVAARIDAGAPDDLLALALEAGFGSKASFNRAFRGRFGVSPSEYRRARRKASIIGAAG